ncbi:MAG: hypothetical protein J6F33_00865, partial [Acidaminococcaceae bacterium]|nr:hypothetical protein [Acidaminococcaceae bacterium]
EALSVLSGTTLHANCMRVELLRLPPKTSAGTNRYFSYFTLLAAPYFALYFVLLLFAVNFQ